MKQGDRVATFAWNTQRHLEAYLAVPCMGAVLHTLNIRLFAEQLAYIVNHAEDSVILVDGELVEPLAELAPSFESVRAVRRHGRRRPGRAAGRRLLRGAARRAGAGLRVPELDERAAAGMCYTSGTTGNPKGVLYSHRSNVLHAMAQCLRTRSARATTTG